MLLICIDDKMYHCTNAEVVSHRLWYTTYCIMVSCPLTKLADDRLLQLQLVISSTFISPTATETCNDKEMNNGLMADNKKGKCPSC